MSDDKPIESNNPSASSIIVAKIGLAGKMMRHASQELVRIID